MRSGRSNQGGRRDVDCSESAARRGGGRLSGWWGQRTARAAAVSVAALALALPVVGGGLDGFLQELNSLIALEGPVPGSTAEDLPEGLDPEANHFAFEGGQTGTFEDAGTIWT